jgi:hypothetical protein
MPEPDMGVVGYTTRVGAALTVRGAFWARPRLTLGVVRETTMGGKA